MKINNMNPVSEIWKNPLTLSLHEKRRGILKEEFSELLGCSHNNYLSLFKYLNDLPEKFYSKEAFSLYKDFLNKNDKNSIHNLLNENQHELNKALHALEEVNRYNWHDNIIEFDEFEEYRFCDTVLNSTYLKLVESVLNPFIFIIACHLRLCRGKSQEGLDIFNSIEELNKTPYSNLCSFYNHTIRNGIAHGGVVYKQREIVYKGKKGAPEIVSVSTLLALIDNLIDVCNGSALAIKLFYLMYVDTGLKMPLQIMIEELQAQTESPWWRIEGCLISEINVKPQLMIYAKPSTRDYLKVQYATFLTGVLSEQLAPLFDRYFVSLHSPISLAGWAAFDGKKLRKIREKGPRSFEDYKGVLEDDMVFYVPKIKWPKILNKLETYIRSYKIHKILFIDNVRLQRKIPEIAVRDNRIHRNGKKTVLSGSVVITNFHEEDAQHIIRRYRKKIIKRTLKDARRKLFFNNICKYLPLGFARISVFCQDYRKRKLRSFGLGDDLICTVEIKKIARVRAPDIYGSTIEQKGRYRMAWNKAWLKKHSINVVTEGDG